MRTDLKRATTVVKHSLVVAGHATSISLEEAFWQALKAHAAEHSLPLAKLVATIDAARDGANLSSAIRVFLLQESQAGARRHCGSAAEGSRAAGDGW